MKKILSVCLLIAAGLACFAKDHLTIHLMGDSTCATYNTTERSSYRGWGQIFPFFFDKGVVVVNYAKGGASTKTFQEKGIWEDVKAMVKPGDIVMIQFGHNDENTDPRHTEPDEYKANLTLFVTTLKELGAKPVLLTPICRRRFINGHAARYGGGNWNHLNYSPKVFEVAKEQGVPVIDGETRSLQWLENLGSEAAKDYFVWYKPGDYPSPADGKNDDTHLNQKGAYEVAKMFAEDLARVRNEVSPHHKDADYRTVEDKFGTIKVWSEE